MGDLTFEPLIPGALWLVLAAVGVGLLAWYARRRPMVLSRQRWSVVVTLMAIALAGVLGLLLNPTWARELEPPAGKPVLTVLVDSSQSMATPDATNGASRFVAAGDAASGIANQLAERFDVQVRTFDQLVRTSTASSLNSEQPNGSSTDVGNALNAVLTEDRPSGQAIVLLSDGIDNVGGSPHVLSAVRTARALSTPIYTRTFGGEIKTLDLAIDLRSPQDMALVGQMVPVDARVTHTGLSTGKANVHLLEAGREIATREVPLGTTESNDVHFQVSHDKVGVYPYELRVDPLPGEVSQANNSTAFVLRVVNEPIRVLVLEGKPYWDSKFFTRTLMEDRAVAIDCVVKLNDERLMRRTLSGGGVQKSTTAPVADDTDRVESWKIETSAKEVLASSERLRGYQLIVLGRDADAFLDANAIANLQDWVSRQGGSLLCYRGSPTASPNATLEKLMPARWSPGSQSRFHVVLTEQGKDLNWFSATSHGNNALPALPTLAANETIVSPKPLAVVLASAVSQGAQQPAVIYQPYGSGRVVVVEGAGMWRWAFLPPGYQDQEQVYISLWHSMLRWLTSGQGLAPGQQLSLRSDKIRFGTEEEATATLLAREDTRADKLPMVKLTAEGVKDPRPFAAAPFGSEAGVFRVTFGKLPEGRYRASLENLKSEDDPAQQVMFDVRKYDQESLELEARPDLMARIASDSGGEVLAGDAASQIQQSFTQHLARTRPPRIEQTCAWDRGWVMMAVLSLWTACWAVRRSGGLV